MRVVYRKYDGTLHWNHDAHYLGEDEHGRWAGIACPGQVFKGEIPQPVQSPHVILFPDAWWTATFNAPPVRTEIYCDITTVPVWTGTGEVTMVDLDLDVRRRRTGGTDLLDEDEFAEHQVRYRYPREVVEQAEAAATWLFEAVAAGVEPFGTAYRRWLAMAVALPGRGPAPARDAASAG